MLPIQKTGMFEDHVAERTAAYGRRAGEKEKADDVEPLPEAANAPVAAKLATPA